MRDSAAGPTAAELLSHVLAAEHIWYSRLVGQPAAVPVWPILSLADCQHLAEENLAGLRRYAKGLDRVAARTGITYVTTTGQTFTTPAEDILLHVCLHGAYHRGQIASIVRGGGADPTPTDYIAFTRDLPPPGQTP